MDIRKFIIPESFDNDLETAFAAVEKRIAKRQEHTAVRKNEPRGRIPKGKAFLTGRIPMEWVASMSLVSKKSLPVALVILFLVRVNHSPTIALESKWLRAMGVARTARNTALRELEAAGLIRIERHRGRLPRVTLLAMPWEDSKTPQRGDA